MDALFKWTGMRTLPNIFLGKHHIGGYTELINFDKFGILEDLAKEHRIEKVDIETSK